MIIKKKVSFWLLLMQVKLKTMKLYIIIKDGEKELDLKDIELPTADAVRLMFLFNNERDVVFKSKHLSIKVSNIFCRKIV